MVTYNLSEQFRYFFNRLNPSPTYISKATSEYNAIKELIENKVTPELSPVCFLQGSYKQQTAIYTINDIDLVVLCQGLSMGSSSGEGRKWSRNEIFSTIASPILNNERYRDKVLFHDLSMCIKIDLGIKIEILPVVNNQQEKSEPFRAYHPEKGKWENVYPRIHQMMLTWKNSKEKTNGNFIPAIKVFKHIRSKYGLDISSFHIECLLFSMPDNIFLGSPLTFISSILNYFARSSASAWYDIVINQPSGDKNIFVPTECSYEKWLDFHHCMSILSKLAQLTVNSADKNLIIEAWQVILGDNYFPRQVS